MTLTEKLNLISELETAKFNSNTIETIVESIEHPENNNGPFDSLEDFWNHIDELPDEEETEEDEHENN